MDVLALWNYSPREESLSYEIYPITIPGHLPLEANTYPHFNTHVMAALVVAGALKVFGQRFAALNNHIAAKPHSRTVPQSSKSFSNDSLSSPKMLKPMLQEKKSVERSMIYRPFN